jgi:hypothetical protein
MMGPRAPWLGRFVDPAVIRRLGAVRHMACRDAASGERLLVVAVEHEGDPERARRLADEVARLHEVLRHPRIPPLDHRGAAAGTEYVALRSNAIVDMEALLQVALARGIRLSAGAAAAFLFAVTDTLRAAHASVDPQSGLPICLGAASAAYLVVSERGQLQLVGWGYPTTTAARQISMREAPTPFLAWEAELGATPTPNGDLDALGRLFHSMLGAVEMPDELFAAARGADGPGRQQALVELVVELEPIAHAQDPERRSWDGYLAIVRRILELVEVTPGDDALEAELASACREWRRGVDLHVARDGRAFTPPSGSTTDLGRRPSLRRMLAALVARRAEAPGEPLTADALFEAGWPGDRVGVESGRNRVRVAVSTLRAMGLRDVLVSRDDGYLIDPDAPITIEDVSV